MLRQEARQRDRHQDSLNDIETERKRGSTRRKSERNSEWMSHLLLWIKAPASRHCGAG